MPIYYNEHDLNSFKKSHKRVKNDYFQEMKPNPNVTLINFHKRSTPQLSDASYNVEWPSFDRGDWHGKEMSQRFERNMGVKLFNGGGKLTKKMSKKELYCGVSHISRLVRKTLKHEAKKICPQMPNDDMYDQNLGYSWTLGVAFGILMMIW